MVGKDYYIQPRDNFHGLAQRWGCLYRRMNIRFVVILSE